LSLQYPLKQMLHKLAAHIA